MNSVKTMLNNDILISAVLGWLVAQLLKTGINTFFTKKFSAERLIGSGGMPSSHSSTVCALATATVYHYGVSSFEFAVTAILAIIVMYDAMGVRRETGEQAKLLNKMMESLTAHDGSPFSQDKLKEFIGHTPIQVIAGIILGISIAIIYINIVN